jgi:cyclopropane-fatty-acyl-phospholipid synthase
MTVRGLTHDGARGRVLLDASKRFASAPSLLTRLISPGFRTMVRRIDAGLERGSLLAHLPDGTTETLGGRAPGFDAEIELKDWRSLLRLAASGVIGFYQGYEAGEWETPDMVALLTLMSANVRTLGETNRITGPFKWAARIAHRLNRNSKAGSERNIAAHYDLGNDFYEQWLGDHMCYSSALFSTEPGPSKRAQMMDELRVGQLKKMTTIANRANLPYGGRVLEIGCGWGMQALLMAALREVHVDAISLSNEQLELCRYRRDNSPNELFGDVAFRRQDYRDVGKERAGTYDAIVSVEMVEALGREFWPTFMDCVSHNLKPGGRAAIQYISIADDLFDAYAQTVDFIQAYIFPGGMLIRTSEFRALAEERGLEWRDQNDFGLDYAETLRLWHANFDAAVREKRLPAGFDERFIRLWKFYLAYCEAGFRAGNIDVHQITLVKS